MKNPVEIRQGDFTDLSNEHGYFDMIKERTENYINSNRAALIIFETKERLDLYNNYEKDYH